MEMKQENDVVNVDLNELTGEMKTFVEGDESRKDLTGFLSPKNVKEQASVWRKNLRPFGEFFHSNRFKVPNTVSHAATRVVGNLQHFRSNYLCVILLLVIYCILSSPMLLIAMIAGLGASHVVQKKSAERKLKLFGRELTRPQQYGLVGVLCFPLFWIAGAGAAVFWTLGASFFSVMAHATMYAIEELPKEDPILSELEVV